MSGDVVPATREWSAITVVGHDEDENAWFLLVSGEVELGNENEKPQLSLSDPPSIEPSVLSLDLQIYVDGESDLHMHWKTVELRQNIISGTYATLRVLWQGIEVASLKM